MEWRALQDRACILADTPAPSYFVVRLQDPLSPAGWHLLLLVSPQLVSTARDL